MELGRTKGSQVALAVIFGCATWSMHGCGGPERPETAPVTGQVTVNGKPLEKGTIQFIPTNGRLAMGQIVKGNYSLTTFEENDGALLGNHVVTVTAMEVSRNKKLPKFEPPADATPSRIRVLEAEWLERHGGRIKVKWHAPEKYSDSRTSPLTAEISPGENVKDFSIESK